LQIILEFLFASLLLLIFIVGGIFILSTSFINVSFTIFAGCASVIFAWARNTEIEDHKQAAKLKHHGESLFLSALCFVMASI